MSFRTNLFINCPFDDDYRPLLKALIFTALYFELEPKIATTVSSAHLRINEIIGLIRSSKYSIHDISRSEPLKKGDLPRFNMPYEMGIDIGCITFGTATQKTKRCLILEKTKNRYDKVISDISGQDIKVHNDNPKRLIERVIEWLAASGAIAVGDVVGITKMWSEYLECIAKIEVTLLAAGFTRTEINKLSMLKYIDAMKSALQ